MLFQSPRLAFLGVERALNKRTCHQLVPHVGSQILHLQTCLDFRPLLGSVEQKVMAAMRHPYVNLPPDPGAPRSKSTNTMKRRLKPEDAENWTRNMGVSLEGGRSNRGHGGKLLSAHHMFSALKAGALHLSLALGHIFFSKYSLPLPNHQVVWRSLPTTFARWTSFVHHFIQGFSTGIAFALQGTHGDMWRQLWLSRLGLGVGMGLLASSELKPPTRQRQPSMTRYFLFFNINGSEIERRWLSQCLLLDSLLLFSLSHFLWFISSTTTTKLSYDGSHSSISS